MPLDQLARIQMMFPKQWAANAVLNTSIYSLHATDQITGIVGFNVIVLWVCQGTGAVIADDTNLYG